MNILQLLKSRIGAVSRAGVLGTSVTLGLVGMNFYSYISSSPAAQQQQIRSLSQIISSGGDLPREYSGIRITRGAMQFATPEEIAQHEGSFFDGGEASVERLEGLNGMTVKGRGLGAGEAGLGMGGNEAGAVGGNGRPGVGNITIDGSVVGNAAAQMTGPKDEKGGGAGGELKRAPMARASGSNLGSGGGAGTFFGPGQGRPGVNGVPSNVRVEGADRVGAPSISGSMPGGNTLVLANARLAGARSASYVPPSNRQSHLTPGSQSMEGRSLRQIAIISGKVAANARRADNEGAAPFMAQENLAGGVELDDEPGNVLPTEGVGDDSYGDPATNGQLDNLDNTINELDTYEQNRKAHRDRLVKTLIGLIAATFMAMIAIDALVRQGTWWSYALAGVLTLAMLAAIVLHGVDASNYARAYDEPGTNWLHWGMGGLLAVGLGLAWVSGSKNKGFMKSVATFLNKNMGVQLLSTTILGSLSGLGVSSTIETVKGVSNFSMDDIKEQKEIHDDKLKNE